MTKKPQVGAPLPSITLPLVAGDRSGLRRGAGWQLIVIYRGRHCPRCKPYLAKLQSLLPELALLGVDVLALSADPLDKVSADVKEHGWTFPVAYGLDIDQMRELGVYISEPTSPKETTWPYSEPAIFVVNPDGLVHVAGLSNAASCRPDLDLLLDGIKGIQSRQLPIRGLLT